MFLSYESSEYQIPSLVTFDTHRGGEAVQDFAKQLIPFFTATV